MADEQPRTWRGPAPYDPDDVRRHQEAKAEAMMIGGAHGYFRFSPWDARIIATAPMLTLLGLAFFISSGRGRWTLCVLALIVVLRGSRVRVEETPTGLHVVNLLSGWRLDWQVVSDVRTVSWIPLRPIDTVIQLRTKRGVWRRRRITATLTANAPARCLLVAALFDRLASVGVHVNITSADFGL